MTTVFTCATPKEAWALVSHFLGNSLQTIASSMEMLKEGGDQNKDKLENVIDRTQVQLIGNLYMLVRKMNEYRHYVDALNIGQILDLVANQDVAKDEVRKAIFDKNEEFNAGRREMRAALEKLRAGHEG